MGNALTQFDLERFIAWENDQQVKNEFIDGKVVPMVDSRRVHGSVLGNVVASLKQQLKGTRCRVFADSMKLQVDDNLFYPDVFVTCDAADLRTEQVFHAPTVVVEVLSPSTHGYDRGLKFANYRRIASLAEYALVDPDTREVTLFRRGADGLFTLHDFTGAEAVEFASIGCRIAREDLFDGIENVESGQPSSADDASA